MSFLEAEPDADIGSRFIAAAYVELASCRSVGFGMGPIPWTAMVTWCLHNGLDREVSDHLIHVIARVDGIIVKRDNIKRAMPRPAPKGRR